MLLPYALPAPACPFSQTIDFRLQEMLHRVTVRAHERFGLCLRRVFYAPSCKGPCLSPVRVHISQAPRCASCSWTNSSRDSVAQLWWVGSTQPHPRPTWKFLKMNVSTQKFKLEAAI